MNKELLLARIHASNARVAHAEQQLASVLRAASSPQRARAEKATITDTMREALATLGEARLDLEALGKLVADDGV